MNQKLLISGLVEHIVLLRLCCVHPNGHTLHASMIRRDVALHSMTLHCITLVYYRIALPCAAFRCVSLLGITCIYRRVYLHKYISIYLSVYKYILYISLYVHKEREGKREGGRDGWMYGWTDGRMISKHGNIATKHMLRSPIMGISPAKMGCSWFVTTSWRPYMGHKLSCGDPQITCVPRLAD